MYRLNDTIDINSEYFVILGIYKFANYWILRKKGVPDQSTGIKHPQRKVGGGEYSEYYLKSYFKSQLPSPTGREGFDVIRMFNVKSHYKIVGRGDVYVVVWNQEQYTDLRGKEVILGDATWRKRFKVVGVESQGHISKGSKIGLLVTEIDTKLDLIAKLENIHGTAIADDNHNVIKQLEQLITEVKRWKINIDQN